MVGSHTPGEHRASTVPDTNMHWTDGGMEGGWSGVILFGFDEILLSPE